MKSGNRSRPRPLVVAALVSQILAAATGRAGHDRRVDAIVEELRSLRDDGWPARAPLVESLVAIGDPAVPVMIELFRDDNRIARWAASDVLANLGEEVVPTMLEALSDPDSRVRSGAEEVLVNLAVPVPGEPANPSVVTQVMAALSYDRRGRGQHGPIDVLVNVGDGAVAPLLGALEGADPLLRRGAVETLAHLAGLAGGSWVATTRPVSRTHREKIVAALRAMLDDPDLDVRTAARGVDAEQRPPATTDELARTLRTGPIESRRAALSSLAGGSDDRSVVPLLIGALADPDPQARAAAALALGHIRPPDVDAVAALGRALGVNEPSMVRDAAALALASLAPGVDAAAPAMAEALRSGTVAARVSLAHALGGTRGADELVVPALVAALTDPGLDTRLAAIDALRRLGRRAREGLPAIVETDVEERYFAPALAIEAIDLDGGAAALTARFATQDSSRRLEAIEVACRLDHSETNALLVRALKDPSPDVRRTAAGCMALVVSDGVGGAVRRRTFTVAGSREVVVAALDLARRDEDTAAAEVAASSLDAMTRTSAEPRLGTALAPISPDPSDLDSPEPAVRETTLRALAIAAHYGDGLPPTVVARIARQLDDDHQEVRRAALEALAALGPAAAPELSRIEPLLSSNDAAVRRQARAVLHAARNSVDSARIEVIDVGPEAIELLASDPPTWPLWARLSNRSWDVEVEVTFGPDGACEEARVVEGDEHIGEVAANSARRFEIVPLDLAGRRVRPRVRFHMRCDPIEVPRRPQ